MNNGSKTKNISLREATGDDLPFLREMCYLAAHPSDEKATSEQSFKDAATKLPWMKDYVEGWGREGDSGLIAVNSSGQNVGAAWYRNHEKDGLPPYELSIAVKGTEQGNGIGKLLLSELLDQARRQGVDEIVLQVQADNQRAHALYENLGFITVGQDDGYEIMAAKTALNEP